MIRNNRYENVCINNYRKKYKTKKDKKSEIKCDH